MTIKISRFRMDMNNLPIKNLGAPTVSTDAARLQDAALTAASQAEMEAATSNTVTVTPLNTKWQPGVAKAWLKAAGTTAAIQASYNITSTTDDDDYQITVTIGTDFSSADYVISPAAIKNNSGGLPMIWVQAAGSFTAKCYLVGQNAYTEPTSYYFACFGDQ